MTNAQPNIIVFFNDDHGQWALNAYGNGELDTPNMDYLARAGVTLENAYTPIPVCSPARASFFTGLLPSQHGVHDYISNHPEFADRVWLDGMKTLPERLRDDGYDTAMFGKWHLGNDTKPQAGFDHWVTLNGDYPILPGGAHTFSINGQSEVRSGFKTQIITDELIKYLRTRKSDRPCFIFVGYTATHSPWEGQPDRLVSHYRAKGLKKIPNGSDYPFGEQALESKDLGRRDDPAEGLAQYYAAITSLDEAIGRITDELDAMNALGNTLMVYTSDHGLCCGHHGIWGKGNGTLPLNMVEESIRIPMIFCQPGAVEGGLRLQERVDHLDLYQTLLDFVGVRPDQDEMGRYAGRSFKQLLSGHSQTDAWRNIQYSEYGTVRMARDARYKLVKRYDGQPSNFFDLHADPDETDSKFDEPVHQERITQMTEKMEAFFRHYQDDAMHGLRPGGPQRTNVTSPWSEEKPD